MMVKYIICNEYIVVSLQNKTTVFVRRKNFTGKINSISAKILNNNENFQRLPACSFSLSWDVDTFVEVDLHVKLDS